MARRWTPQRFSRLRRIRVAACALTVTAMMAGTFALTARKTVAISVDGETRTALFLGTSPATTTTGLQNSCLGAARIKKAGSSIGKSALCFSVPHRPQR